MTEEIRNDDWVNTFSSMGSIKDKSTGVQFLRAQRLPRRTLEALYEQHAIAARIVDRLPDDAFREGYEITKLDVDVPNLRSRLDDWGIDQALAQGVRWSRLYGGAVVLLPTLDSAPPEKAIENPTCVLPPVVYSADDARPLKYDNSFGSPTFRQTLTYQLGGQLTAQLEVHRSRVITFESISLPPEVLSSTPRGWGPSILNRIYDPLKKYGATLNHAASMLYIASILYLQFENYRKTAQTKEGQQQLKTILENTRKQLDLLGILGLDKNDKVGSVTHTLTGVHELIDRQRDYVAMCADMPKEIIFNESPAGLNAGELSGPQELWFAVVATFQKNILTPALDRALELFFEANSIPATSWEIVWRPLWTRSDSAQAGVDKTRADTDLIYWNIGAASTEDIRRHRLVEGRTDQIEIEEELSEPGLEITSEDLEAYTGAISTTPDLPNQTSSDQVEVASQALNGAQIESLVAIVEKVSSGLLPRDSAVSIIRAAFPSQAHRAEQILGSAGITAGTEDEATSSTDPVPGDLMSPQDAATQFGVPTRTITRQIELGRLRFWGLGAHKRVSAADVAILAKAHEQPDDATS